MRDALLAPERREPESGQVAPVLSVQDGAGVISAVGAPSVASLQDPRPWISKDSSELEAEADQSLEVSSCSEDGGKSKLPRLAIAILSAGLPGVACSVLDRVLRRSNRHVTRRAYCFVVTILWLFELVWVPTTVYIWNGHVSECQCCPTGLIPGQTPPTEQYRHCKCAGITDSHGIGSSDTCFTFYICLTYYMFLSLGSDWILMLL